MSVNQTKYAPSETLIKDLLDTLDALFGYHAGSRPVHAKGIICQGTFTPAPEALKLTKAPHVSLSSVPVVVRFSNFAGIPTIPDNAPNGASPRGFAVRFYLGDHVHTDVIGHSENGFPSPTGEDFLQLAKAIVASPPDAKKPTALESYFETHPVAKEFLTAPKPIPVSYSKESFFDPTAFKFINAAGETKFGRFRVVPENAPDDANYLSNEQAAKKDPDFLANELRDRLSQGPFKMKVQVQIADGQDNVNDCSIAWPESRPLVEFGTLTITECVDDQDPEMKKIIFDPIPRIDGIDASDDPIIQVRSEIYLMSGRRRRAAASPH